MRRITLWLCATVSAVVLLFSYHTSTQGAATTAATGTLLTPGTVVVAPLATTPPDRASTAPNAAQSVVNGSVAQTRYGPIQVQVTVLAGKVVKAQAVAYPTGGRDGEINSVAIPQLDDEATTARSAQIDTVSGATFTSDGYRESLQAALDAAHLS